MVSKGQNPKQKRPRNNSVLEALRDLSGGVGKTLTEDFLGQIPEDIFTQGGLRPKNTPGTFEPQESVNFDEIKELRSRLRQAEFVRHQEQVVFSAQQQETKAKVAALVEEAKNLSGAVQQLEQVIEVATVQTPVNPGVYHVNFFEKLISFIRSLTQSVEGASVWIASSQQKGKKRSYYWGQFQKSGSKFMLSQERYMATQAG